MNAILRMMTVRKQISAALVGVAVLVFVVFAMGSGSSPTFGDPFSGLSTTLQARIHRRPAKLRDGRHGGRRPGASLQQRLLRDLPLHACRWWREYHA